MSAFARLRRVPVTGTPQSEGTEGIGGTAPAPEPACVPFVPRSAGAGGDKAQPATVRLSPLSLLSPASRAAPQPDPPLPPPTRSTPVATAAGGSLGRNRNALAFADGTAAHGACFERDLLQRAAQAVAPKLAEDPAEVGLHGEPLP